MVENYKKFRDYLPIGQIDTPNHISGGDALPELILLLLLPPLRF